MDGKQTDFINSLNPDDIIITEVPETILEEINILNLKRMIVSQINPRITLLRTWLRDGKTARLDGDITIITVQEFLNQIPAMALTPQAIKIDPRIRAKYHGLL